MTRLTCTRTLLFSILCGAAALVAPVGAVEAERADQLTLQEWSRLVWESASRGEQGKLEAYLKSFPKTPEDKLAADMRAAIDLHNNNLQVAQGHREEGLADARGRMNEQFEAGEVSQPPTRSTPSRTTIVPRMSSTGAIKFIAQSTRGPAE